MEISATDATITRAGATRSAVPQTCANMLYAACERHGEYVRLDGDLSDGEGEPTTMVQATEDLCELVPSLDWRVSQQYAFRRFEHINTQELKALVAEVKDRGLVLRGVGSRLVCLLDSRVCVGALAKGRSSSRQLNDCLRKFLGWRSLLRVGLSVLWINTHDNPADDPSREADLRAPKVATTRTMELLTHGYVRQPHLCDHSSSVDTCDSLHGIVGSSLLAPPPEPSLAAHRGKPGGSAPVPARRQTRSRHHGAEQDTRETRTAAETKPQRLPAPSR